VGHRLSKIYTRTGDSGETGLGDGSRIAKDSLRVSAYGEVDELNSVIGMLRVESLPAPIDTGLANIQHRLFDLGGELCIPGHSAISDEQVTGLEVWLDELNADLTPLKDFILPGGSRAGAVAHLGRTVCRRAERAVVSLAKEETINATGLAYLNRLSDLLFVLARVLNRDAGAADVLWSRDS